MIIFVSKIFSVTNIPYKILLNSSVKALLLIVAAYIFVGCNTVKYVPDNKYLLDKNYLSIDNKNFDRKEIEGIIKQKPNRRILGFFKVQLWLYNLSKPGSSKWFSRTVRKFGAEPVVYDKLFSDKSDKQISLFLRNKGYFNAIVKDSAVYKNKKVDAYYYIKTGLPYKLNHIGYKLEDSTIHSLILSDTANSYLKAGNPFELDNMQNECSRIETFLKNKGYFAFSKDLISFEADTALNDKKVNLDLVFKNQFRISDTDTLVIPKYSLFKIGDIRLVVDNETKEDTTIIEGTFLIRDTFLYNDIYVIYKNKVIIKPSLLANDVYIVPGELYNQKSVDETYRSLSSLKIFKFINVSFTERDKTDSSGYRIIDCHIFVSTTNFQSYQTEAEITNSAGIGVAGSIIYQHKNLLKGAETLDVRIKGATEAVKKTESSQYFQTLELSAGIKIQFPNFLLPLHTEGFVRKYNPKTVLSISYSYLRRPEFTITNSKTSFGYNWKGNTYTSFQVLPIDINYVRLIDASQTFKDQINNTYLKFSYQDHMVSVTSFNFTFNTQKAKKNTIFNYVHFNIESAGNVLELSNKIVGSKTDSVNEYRVFKIPFSQFIKSDVDYRYYLPINSTDRIVYRIFGGFALPYGNSKSVPFEEQYFSGGANSIRAWQVRSLGPGSYKDTSKSYYPDKTSDIKLEGNIEYRFKLFWILEGAIFVDAGNIWSINKNDTREGATFKADEFYKQIAVGTGFGTRFDFSFFIFRFDVGLKLRDPSQPINDRWIITQKIKSDYFNYNIGIGYPF